MLGRLTLVLAVGIGVAMLSLGTPPPKPQEHERITETVLDPGDAPVIEVAANRPAPALENVRPTALASNPAADELVENAVAEALEDSGSTEPPAALSVALAEAIETPDTPAEDRLYVTGDRVNLRDGPSTYDPVVVRLNLGDETRLIADAGHGWLLVRAVESGRQGFMSADYLSPRPPLD